MKRELKRGLGNLGHASFPFIAKPIPMKRELKPLITHNGIDLSNNCKAYPDEKGIETVGVEHDPFGPTVPGLQSLSR